MNSLPDNYDVVIAGGGPAGASAAIHLAERGARVLLAEQKKFPRAKLCGEFISPECVKHFARLGVAERMLGAGGVALNETRFYTRGGESVGVPSEWFGGSSTLALGLSRAEMDARLLARAREVGVRVLEETQAVGVLIVGGRVCGLRLKTETEVRVFDSLLVIDATGRSCALARRIQASGEKRTPHKRASLVAFKAHLEGTRGAQGHCEIYFYRGGYGGLNSVEGGRSNLCFIASARDVRACESDASRVMREVVMANRRAAHTLADARVETEWLGVALESFGRRRLVPADGLITVGDAASFIDPFTGSGMLMALESGELAGETIARWLARLREGEAFAEFTQDYRARYDEKFRARLRVCALMRRAAFVPRLAETLIHLLGKSERARRSLARATRTVSDNRNAFE